MTESVRSFVPWGLASPLVVHRRYEPTEGFTTEASPSEGAVDARALVGEHNPQTDPAPPGATTGAIVGYRPSSAPGNFIRGSRRVSQFVMGLQVQMHHLITSHKEREAVTLFETFVNEAFKEAAAQNLPTGLLPMVRRPAEFQWLQYIEALSRSERVATRQIASAIALMKQVGIPPGNMHYNIYLENIRRQGQSFRACEVIDEMIKSGIRPNTRCYEQAIFTCLLARDLDSTSMLLDNLFRSTTWQKRQQRSGWLLYTKVISFCASLKRIENALTFMKQMTDLQLKIPIHLLLDVAVNAAEVDDTAAVDTLLHDLQSIRSRIYMRGRTEVQLPIKIDEGLLLSVLNCAARTGQAYLADQAWTMLQDCLKIPYHHEIRQAAPSDLPKETGESQSQEPSVEESHEEAATASVEEEDDDDGEEENHDEGREFVKRADLAEEDNWEEQLHSLLHNDVALVESYHAFIEAQAKAGNVERAFEAVLELEEHHPDDPTDLSPAQGLHMLADALAKDAETVDEAYLVLDRWYKEGKRVTVTMLDVIVAACSRMGDANRAFETFEAYPKLGLTHRTESYNALMEVCATQRQVEVIMKLLQEMAKASIKPNVDTYMQILEGYINSGDTSGIAHALNITRREGFAPTLNVLEKAYECADKYNDEQARQLVRRELLAAGHRFGLIFGRRRGRGWGRGRFGFRGGPGRNDAQRSQRSTGSGRGDFGRPPVQTYVGTQRPPTEATQTPSRHQPFEPVLYFEPLGTATASTSAAE